MNLAVQAPDDVEQFLADAEARSRLLARLKRDEIVLRSALEPVFLSRRGSRIRWPAQSRLLGALRYTGLPNGRKADFTRHTCLPTRIRI